jgi:hypothetical protein
MPLLDSPLVQQPTARADSCVRAVASISSVEAASSAFYLVGFDNANEAQKAT